MLNHITKSCITMLRFCFFYMIAWWNAGWSLKLSSKMITVYLWVAYWLLLVSSHRALWVCQHAYFNNRLIFNPMLLCFLPHLRKFSPRYHAKCFTAPTARFAQHLTWFMGKHNSTNRFHAFSQVMNLNTESFFLAGLQQHLQDQSEELCTDMILFWLCLSS